MIEKISNDEMIKLNNLFNDYNIDLKSNPYSECYIIKSNNDIIGCIEFSIIYDRAELNYIFIKKDYRKKGYAQNLIDFMFEKCRTCNNISLEVRVDNYEAISLYERNGFIKISIRKNYYNNVDAYLMVKEVIR